MGLNEDLRIAVVCQGVVSIRTVDSRLFWKCPNDVIPNLPAVKLLMEFTEDKPINFVKEGMLVRPRSHTRIRGYGGKITSFSSCESEVYKAPLYVLGVKAGDESKNKTEKVILAGYTDSEEIHEIEVDKELVCEYNKSG